jgi:hypothetical protein
MALTQVNLIVDGAKMEDGSGVNYIVELTPPGGPKLQNLPMNPDSVYGGQQSLAKGGFAQQAKVLGDWQLKIQRAGATDFKSLPAEDLRNAYLVLGFKTS